MVNQFLYLFDEMHRVRQADVFLERRFVLPSRMHIEEVRVACGTICVNAQTAALPGRGSKHVSNGVFDFLLFARLRMETRENKKLHKAPF